MRAQVDRKVAWWSKSREEPWRAQAASPRQSRSNPNFRGNRVDTIFRAGLLALLFFCFVAGHLAADLFRGFVCGDLRDFSRTPLGADVMPAANLIQHSF